jgi:predicted DCC family thiol-disulfide oxidoreductase YuxK
MTAYLANVFGVDLRSLAAVRIGCALLILFDLVQRSRDLVAHYSDFGVAPRALAMEHSNGRWGLSLHYVSGVWQVQALLFILAAAAAAALLVGYRTRLAAILSWALFTSVCVRQPFVIQGGDIMLRAILFWAIFLPWGAVYSVDSSWRDDSAPRWPRQYLSWATAAYVFQILFVYAFSVTLKSGVQWWSEGSAVYYALNIDSLVTPIGKALLQLPYPLLQCATWAVMFFEITGPILLLLLVKSGKLRLFAVGGFILLHVNFLLTMFIGIFPLINIVAMLFFLPGMFWDRLAHRLEKSTSAVVTIYYDHDCGFCWRMVRLIKTFCFVPQASIAGAQTVPDIAAELAQRNSWIVVDGAGKRHYGYDGLTVAAAASPLLRPLLPLLKFAPVAWVGERLYRFVAIHRRSICPLSDGPSANTWSFAGWRAAGNFFIAALIPYVFVLNLMSVPALGLKLPETVLALGVVTGLNQGWSLFAPFPAKDDGWFVIPGKLRSGMTVDLFRNGKEVSFVKPAYGSLEYKNYRWRKYIEQMRKRDYLQPVYARYLCGEWNRRHQGGETLDELEIIYVLEWTQPVTEYSPIEKQLVYKFKCGV